MARSLTQQQKEEEGQRLREIIVRRKAQTGETQESICNAIRLNPGMLYAIMVGQKALPLETLLDLAEYLAFDPREIRPEIEGLAIRLSALITADEKVPLARSIPSHQIEDLANRLSVLMAPDELSLLAQSVPHNQRQAAIDYLKYLSQMDN